MKVNMDMENLSELVENAINENVQTIVSEKVAEVANNYVKTIGDEIIKDYVAQTYEKILENTVVSYFNNNYGYSIRKGEEPEKIPLCEYIQKLVKKYAESDTISIKKTSRSSWDSSSDYEKISFEEYIKRQLNIEHYVQKEIDAKLGLFENKFKKTISKKVQDALSSATESALSKGVVDILLSTKEYKDILKSIDKIAGEE